MSQHHIQAESIGHKPKIMVLLSRFPYPLNKGDQLRAFYFIKYLSKRYTIFLCALSDEKVKSSELAALQPYCAEIEVLYLSKFTVFSNLLKGLFNDLPFQVNYFYNAAHQKRVTELVANWKPDKLFVQLTRVAEYVREFKGVIKIIDYQDCFSKIMQSRKDRGSWPMKILFGLEANRLKNYEAAVFSDFEKCVIISKADCDAMPLSQKHKKEIAIVPNGVEMEFFSPIKADKDYEVMFTGNMNYPPNVEAATYLVEKVMPLVWEKYPAAKVLLLGTEPHRRVRALHSDRVTVTGWVDDVRPWYAKSKMLVAPMFIGAGLQNKLLQAMAMQLPCITTSLANSALGAKVGEEVLVGENQIELANLILKLLGDAEQMEALSLAGYQYVQKSFSWESALKEI